MADLNIHDIEHPEYAEAKIDWLMWRLVYKGGRLFIQHFTEKYSSREGDIDFRNRKKLTYNPGFARAAVDEIKNSIYQRLVDVSRSGGPQSYQAAILGDKWGVDLLGKNMAAFMGLDVLPELLPMARVGIYVDMPPLSGNESIKEKGRRRPYIYIYRTEDIRSWQWDTEYNPNEFKSVLLIDREYDFDEITFLPLNEVLTYRHVYLKDEGDGKRRVYVQKYNYESEPIGPPIRLDIDRIPFVILQLTESLLKDAAHYQIALLNLASSDLHYCLTANFPFYTEQYSPFSGLTYNKGEENIAKKETDPFTFQTQTEVTEEIRIGISAGRRYPQGLERPAFIHPSSEPLQASVAKQEQLRDEIRMLVGLTLSNIRPKMASAESKQVDVQGVEAGLSYIGMVLQYAERKIAEYWTMYEGAADIAVINYPERYSLQSDSDRREEVKSLAEKLKIASSDTFRKRLLKRIAYLTVGAHIRPDELEDIYNEIDQAEVIVPDMDFINTAVMNGWLDPESAARAFGFPEDTVQQAAKFHAERLKRIQMAQTDPAARGIIDKGKDSTSGALERQEATDPTGNPNPGPLIRGDGDPKDII